jgi:hypothetical protein
MEARNRTLELPHGVRELVDAELWMGRIDSAGSEKGSDVDMPRDVDVSGIKRRSKRDGEKPEPPQRKCRGSAFWPRKSFPQGCSCPAARGVILRHPPPPPRLRHRRETEKIFQASTAEHHVNQTMTHNTKTCVFRSTTATIRLPSTRMSQHLCLERCR